MLVSGFGALKMGEKRRFGVLARDHFAIVSWGTCRAQNIIRCRIMVKYAGGCRNYLSHRGTKYAMDIISSPSL